MTLRALGFSLLAFILGVALVAAIKPNSLAMIVHDDRAADGEAIRAHIDIIFQAFIKRDLAALRATHAQNFSALQQRRKELICRE